MSELVEIKESNALQVFSTGEQIDPILAEIRKQATAFSPDVTTAKGRKEIASMAHKVAQSKTYLDGIGKDLVDQYKEIPKKIDANRKRIRDELDALKDEVRRPLTEWEEAEKARVQGIKDRIETIRQHAAMSEDSTMAKSAISRLESIAIDESFAEFAAEAAQAKDKSLSILRADLEYCIKRESEAAELARLRAEEAKREQEARERKIAEEAAEKARREAEEKADRERAESERKVKEAREAAERRELELKLAAEKAERERIEAIERAEREKNAAIEAERRRIEAESEKVRAEEAARAEDEAHKFSIHSEIISDLGSFIGEKQAMIVINALRDGMVRHVVIKY